MKLFENKERLVRTLAKWDTQTFADAMADFEVAEEDEDVIPLAIEVVQFQRLGDKRMNGYCSESLRKDEFEQMGVCYVDFFNLLEESDKEWTPFDIIFEVCKNNIRRRSFYEKKADKHNMTFEQVTALMCGRALRALPSYIREQQLRNSLQDAFPKASFEHGETLDKKFHCDIKMTLHETPYYFWSFLSSPRSIYQFVDKFRANRQGQILDGHHVLCPFDKSEFSDSAYKGWCFYSSQYVNEVKNAMFNKTPIDYDSIIVGRGLSPKTFKRPVVVDKNERLSA